MTKCKHQFFEIKSIEKWSDRVQKVNSESIQDYWKQKEKHPDSFIMGPLTLDADIVGVLIKCAVCEEEKELWEEPE